MPTYSTETRTDVGDTGALAFADYTGFRLGQQYQLRIERRGDRTVTIALDHAHCVPGLEKVVSAAEFEKWWVR